MSLNDPGLFGGLPRRFAAAGLAGLLAMAGCIPCPKTSLSLSRLVNDYNANCRQVPQLWARARIAVSLPGEAGLTYNWGSASPLAAPNGLLLLFKPQQAPAGDRPAPFGPEDCDFLLVGKEGPQQVFRLGCSADEGKYYLWYGFGSRSGGYIGRTLLAGAPDVKGLPLDPMQLLSALGICELPEDPVDLPAVAMSLNAVPGQCAYVLTYIDRQALTGRIVFKREMLFTWADDKPPRLFRVNIFDMSGRRVMTADVDNYQPIDTGRPAETQAAQNIQPPSVNRPAGPIMPTSIRITWPESPGGVEILLSEMTAQPKAQREAVRTESLPGGANLVPIDRDVQLRGPQK
ncbi:MAG: hypothetical protein HZA50_03150 [Planctomycetes bacterium]|nr:hypothetical protein [Planctomycetota bacterium]